MSYVTFPLQKFHIPIPKADNSVFPEETSCKMGWSALNDSSIL